MTLRTLLKPNQSGEEGILDLRPRGLPPLVAAAAVVAALLAMSGIGCSRGLPATGGCTFSSKLTVKVYIVREADGKEENLGWVHAKMPKGIVIPKCQSWFVEPMRYMDIPALAKDIASKGIPGLRLAGHKNRLKDGDLAHLKGLTGLRMLDVRYAKITDAGLAHLKGLTGLRELTLGNTKITDAGLVHLKGLTELRVLALWSCWPITDAGLAHLKHMKGLRELDLQNTKITDAGLGYLEGLTGLRELDLRGTKITDAGLVHLEGLTGLQRLRLYPTNITPAGIFPLRKALPGLVIDR